MTSRGKRNPAKPDLGGDTRRSRRRIGSACLKLPSTNATAPHTLTGHTREVSALGVAPDGSWLATVSWDNTVRVWDPATGTALTSLRIAGRLTCLATMATTIAAAGEHGPYFLAFRPGTPPALTPTDMAPRPGVFIAGTPTEEKHE